MKYLGSLLCLLGFLTLKSGFGGSGPQSAFHFRTIWEDLTLSISLLIAGIVILFLGRSSTWVAEASSQKSRDAIAVVSLKNDDFSGKSLFLRPFEVDGDFVIKSNLDDDYAIVGQKSLMRTIAEALEPTCPLVAIGDRGGLDFSFGATGYRVDAWRQRVSKAIETADLIVVIPGSNEGVRWEIGEIVCREALLRTLFIMPPLFGKDRWVEAAAKLQQEHQITLPVHTIYGSIFVYDNCKKLKSIKKIDDVFLGSAFHAAGWINEVLH